LAELGRTSTHWKTITTQIQEDSRELTTLYFGNNRMSAMHLKTKNTTLNIKDQVAKRLETNPRYCTITLGHDGWLKPPSDTQPEGLLAAHTWITIKHNSPHQDKGGEPRSTTPGN